MKIDVQTIKNRVFRHNVVRSILEAIGDLSLNTLIQSDACFQMRVGGRQRTVYALAGLRYIPQCTPKVNPKDFDCVLDLTGIDGKYDLPDRPPNGGQPSNS